MTDHTSTPWRLVELDNDKVVPTITILGAPREGQQSGMVVARVDLRRDAKFIKRACNASDALLAVCRDLDLGLPIIAETLRLAGDQMKRRDFFYKLADNLDQRHAQLSNIIAKAT